MNFEDPFGDDLLQFNNITAASLRRDTRLAQANQPFVEPETDFLSVTRAALPINAAAPAVAVSSGSAEPVGSLDLLGTRSAARPGPVAGRRAGTTGAVTAAAAATPATTAARSSPSPYPSLSPATVATQPLSGDAASLPWLEEGGGGTRHTAAASSRHVTILTPSAAQARRVPVADVDDDDPLGFLDPTKSSARPSGVSSSSAQSTARAPDPQRLLQEEQAAARAKLQQERRELYATLDALDAEQRAVQEKLDTREIKEETELLQLDTTILDKKRELAEQEAQQEVKRKELAQYTARRLTELQANRVQQEADQEAEVTALESAKYERQLRQLREAHTTASTSVKELRRQRQLVIHDDPYSPQGIRLALSAASSSPVAAAGAASLSDEAEANRSSADGLAESSTLKGSGSALEFAPAPATVSSQSQGEKGSSGSSSASAVSEVEATMAVALDLVKRYYDERLAGVRDGVVNYIHEETLQSANSVRRTRQIALVQDAVERRERFAEHVQQLLERHCAFFRDSEVRKAQRRHGLHDELLATTTQLRERAKARLASLLKEVTTKMDLAIKQFNETAEEGRVAFETKARRLIEGDQATAAAQRGEVEARCGVEAKVRSRLFAAQKGQLREQLDKARMCAEQQSRERFASLVAEATTSGNARLPALQEQLANTRCGIEQLTQRTRRPRRLHELTPSESDARLHGEELAQSTETLLRVVAQEQEGLTRLQQRCDELRNTATRHLADTAERLRASRQTQQTHRVKVDALRQSWEREHREGLAAPHSVQLPLALPEQGTDNPTATPLSTVLQVTEAEVCSDPATVTLTAFLEYLTQRLRHRDAAQRLLKEARAAYAAARDEEVVSIVSHHNRLQQLWAQLVEQLTVLEEERDGVTARELAIEREALRAKVEQETLHHEHDVFRVRRAELEEEAGRCHSASAAVQAAYSAQEQQLDHLAAVQLKLAHEQCVQAVSSPPVRSATTTAVATRGWDQTRVSLGVQHDGVVCAGTDNRWHRRGSEDAVQEGGADEPPSLHPSTLSPRGRGQLALAATWTTATPSPQRSPTVRVRESGYQRREGLRRSGSEEEGEASPSTPQRATRVPEDRGPLHSPRSSSESPLSELPSALLNQQRYHVHQPPQSQSLLRTPRSTASTSAPTAKLLLGSGSGTESQPQEVKVRGGVCRRVSPPRESTDSVHRVISVSNSAMDTSLVSATSLYCGTPFMDLLTVLDSTNTSALSS